MKGKIKFLDAKSRKWGFIIPEDSTQVDVHFQIEDFVGETPTLDDAGREVEFELEMIDKSRNARKIQLQGAGAKQATEGPAHSSRPGESLKQWAWVPFVPFVHRGTKYSSVLEYLSQIVLPEKWHFGETPNPKNPYPILDNYLTYTYYKLKRDDQVLEKKNPDGDWAHSTPDSWINSTILSSPSSGATNTNPYHGASKIFVSQAKEIPVGGSPQNLIPCRNTQSTSTATSRWFWIPRATSM